jgi:hypothetical protein
MRVMDAGTSRDPSMGQGSGAAVKVNQALLSGQSVGAMWWYSEAPDRVVVGVLAMGTALLQRSLR